MFTDLDRNKIIIENLKLIEYTKKGNKQIPYLRLSSSMFDMIYNKITYIISVDNLELWSNLEFGLWYKHCVFFYTTKDITCNEKLIIGNKMLLGSLIKIREMSTDKSIIRYVNKIIKLIKDHCYDYEIVRDPSIKDGIVSTTTPRKVKSDFKKVAKDLKEEDLQKIVDEIGVEEKDRLKPLSHRTNVFDKIILHTDCLYMDIHKAHSKFIIDTFKDYPKIVNWVNTYNKLSAKAKKKGNIEEAKMYKDYPNLLVGCLGQVNKKTQDPIRWLKDINTRPLYNRCVNNVRNQIDAKLLEIRIPFESELVYAQTDGFIVSHPNWDMVKDSDKVGEFGIQNVDNNQVWTYRCHSTDDYTGYCIYQYFDKGVKKVVGDLPDVLKEYIDLSKGQLVTYKEYRDCNGKCHYENIKIKEIK